MDVYIPIKVVRKNDGCEVGGMLYMNFLHIHFDYLQFQYLRHVICPYNEPSILSFLLHLH